MQGNLKGGDMIASEETRGLNRRKMEIRERDDAKKMKKENKIKNDLFICFTSFRQEKRRRTKFLPENPKRENA